MDTGSHPHGKACCSKKDTPRVAMAVPSVQVFEEVAAELARLRDAAPNNVCEAEPLTVRMLLIPPGIATVEALKTPPKRTQTKVSFTLPAPGEIDGETGLVDEAFRVVTDAPSTNAAPHPDHSIKSHSPPVEAVVQLNDPENAPVAVACL